MLTNRENAIGFLRLVFAAAVLVSHGYLLGGFGAEPLARWTDGQMIVGWLGVQGFFVLSGCLVVESFQRLPSLLLFLWKRALRLFPALWVCLAITALVLTPVARWLAPEAFPDGSLLEEQIGYLIRNLLLPRTQVNIGGGPGGPIPWGGDWNGSLWTLFYEGACYLMIAVLGSLTLLGKRHRAGFAFLVGFLLLHVASRLAPDILPANTGRLFDNGGKLLTLHFLSGAAWALAPVSIKRSLASPLNASLLASALVLGWFTPGNVWLSPLALPPVLFALVERLPFTNLEKRIGGDFSYGIYIYGMPIQQCLACAGVHHFGLAFFLTTTAVLVFSFAWLSWRLVEAPALRLKHRWPVQRAAAPATTPMLPSQCLNR